MERPRLEAHGEAGGTVGTGGSCPPRPPKPGGQSGERNAPRPRAPLHPERPREGLLGSRPPGPASSRPRGFPTGPLRTGSRSSAVPVTRTGAGRGRLETGNGSPPAPRGRCSPGPRGHRG